MVGTIIIISIIAHIDLLTEEPTEYLYSICSSVVSSHSPLNMGGKIHCTPTSIFLALLKFVFLCLFKIVIHQEPRGFEESINIRCNLPPRLDHYKISVVRNRVHFVV